MNVINWKLSVSLELDKDVRWHFDVNDGNFKRDLPNLVKVAVQDFIKSGDYKNYTITAAQLANKETDILVQWNIPVNSTLDKSVHKILITGSTDLCSNLSDFVEQAMLTYFHNFRLKCFAKIAPGSSRSELESFLKFMDSTSNTESKNSN
jgi:hypothetical protein